jgi:adenosylcobinamide-phosphate synthase
MGRIIQWCDDRIRLICRSARSLRTAGICLAIGLPLLSYALAALVLDQARAVSVVLTNFVTIVLASMTLAARDLWDHVKAVRLALAEGNVVEARAAVSRIVGRDTDNLTESEIVRATVETIAESTADGVMAPLVFLTIGGPPLALAYKAVSTLDSMIGHREPKYIDFGWASARLDDAANWIPARLTAALIILAAGLTTGEWNRVEQSLRILRRDGDKHASPNSGRPEAAMAGALGIQLGGCNTYEGLPYESPRMGDGTRPLVLRDIQIAVRIAMMAYLIGFLLAMVALWLA